MSPDAGGAAGQGAPQRVAVLGLGLIGGSLARDLSASGCHVVGGDTDPDAVSGARREKAIRQVVDVLDPSSWHAALTGVDMVVLAVPVDITATLLERLAGAVPGRTVLTDTGGTKRSQVAAAERAGLAARFVGSHPMAGDHRSGWTASRPGLFRGATTWVCPAAARPGAVAAVEALWRGVGARTLRSEPLAHDRMMAWGSHLPQAAASALGAVLGEAGLRPGQLGPGGRDTTRIAASHPDLWSGILLDNGDLLEPALGALEEKISLLRTALQNGDRDSLRSILAGGRQWADGTESPGGPSRNGVAS